jgi:hypothetical protein
MREIVLKKLTEDLETFTKDNNEIELEGFKLIKKDFLEFVDSNRKDSLPLKTDSKDFIVVDILNNDLENKEFINKFKNLNNIEGSDECRQVVVKMLSIIRNSALKPVIGYDIHPNYLNLLRNFNFNSFCNNDYNILYNDKIVKNLFMYMCCSVPFDVSDSLSLVSYLNNLTFLSNGYICEEIVVNTSSDINLIRDKARELIETDRNESIDKIAEINNNNLNYSVMVLKYLKISYNFFKFSTLAACLGLGVLGGKSLIIPLSSSILSLIVKNKEPDNFLTRFGSLLVELGRKFQ